MLRKLQVPSVLLFLFLAFPLLTPSLFADEVTLKNGDIIYYYLDPDTYMEIREETQEFIRGSMRESVHEMGSYKPVAGVMFPYWMSSGSREDPAQQTTIVESIEVNVPIDPADFALPASLKQGGKSDTAKK